MKIGFDIDGVFANFENAFERAIVQATGIDRFPGGAGNLPPQGPPEWNWPTLYGYSNADMAAAMKLAHDDREFWANLAPFEANIATLRTAMNKLALDNDCYFVTHRNGLDAKFQTETWLRLHTHAFDAVLDWTPTVLMTKHKGLICAALGLDIYIDDNADNVNDCVYRTRSDRAITSTPPALNAIPRPDTRVYLLDRDYNRRVLVDERVVRVATVQEMFDLEGIK